MEFLNQLGQFFTNEILLVPAVAWLVAQLLKTLINGVVHKEWSAERLWGDGGMPSGHSATVSSLATMCGITCGFGSPTFALSFIFAVVVMHDAVGVRREAGKQAVTLKKLAALVNGAISDPDKRIRTEKLKEFIGHTPMQVFFGALLGIVVSVVYVVIAKVPYMGFA